MRYLNDQVLTKIERKNQKIDVIRTSRNLWSIFLHIFKGLKLFHNCAKFQVLSFSETDSK